MECKKAKVLIPDLIRDAESCPNRESLQKHLNNCPSCHQEWCQSRDAIGTITGNFDWKNVGPSAKLQREIYKAAKEESARVKASVGGGGIRGMVKRLLKK